jgi:tetratricopeptide (TPR) repeat protein
VKPRIAILLFLAAAAIGQQAADTAFEALSNRARQAYEANHPQEAANLYRQAVKLRPDWAQGWWALGMIEYERDHYPECRDALARMVGLDTAAAPGWALLGLCEFRTTQYDASFEHLKKAHMLVSVRQGRGELLDIADYHLALLLTRQGAFEVAQEVLVKVALRVRSSSEMMFASGLAGLRMAMLPSEVRNDHRDVVSMAGKAFWDLATQPPAEAEADFRALVAKYPKFPNVHYFYGTYLAAHRPEECTPEFLEELHVAPDSVPARVQLALRYTVEGKLEDAAKMAREAVALSPDSVGPHLAFAETLRAQGDDEKALGAFLTAKRLDPVSPKIRLFLVNVYRALGRVEEMRREQSEYDRLKAEQLNWP